MEGAVGVQSAQELDRLAEPNVTCSDVGFDRRAASRRTVQFDVPPAGRRSMWNTAGLDVPENMSSPLADVATTRTM